MLIVENKPFVLSVIMLNVVMLSVIAPSKLLNNIFSSSNTVLKETWHPWLES
jgi:hypothetical protein